MCTVSWLHQDGGYQLFSNRDEKRTRSAASGPEIRACEGVRFLAPRDGEAGGTWIGVNELGVSLCLLNHYPRGWRPGGHGYRSRGLLLPRLLAAESAADAARRFWDLSLLAYAPFVVVAIEPGTHAWVLEWDGGSKAVLPYGEPLMPLASSSFDPDGVRIRRRNQFRRRLGAAGKLDADSLLAFHRSHGRKPSAYSPCMHRLDAMTVSFSWVRVTDSHAEFCYTPGPPCRGLPGQVRRLALHR